MESKEELIEDEEEVLVYVEFEGFVNNNIFTNEQLQLDMVGIDTDHPIMQIDGRFYEGTYEDVVGTYMFFERDDEQVVDDPIFDQAPTLKYFGKTRKLLKMQRIFVKQRTEVLGDSEHSKCIPNIDTIKEAGIPPKYQFEALSFWKDVRDRRIDALCTYLEKQRIREEKKSQGIVVDSESDEDNPFAIYKYKEEQKSEKNLENEDINLAMDIAKFSASESISKEESNKGIMEGDLDILKYINPEPSTSKSSDPCTSVSYKVHKPTVKVIRKKTRNIAKGISARKHKKKEIVEDDATQNVNDFNPESSPILNKVSEDSVIDVMPSTSTSVGNVETSENNGKNVNTDSDPVDNSTGKGDTKLLKREAKMKEISDRLKSVAEEYLKGNVDHDKEK